MTGLNHIASGACSLILLSDAVIYAKNYYNWHFVDKITDIGNILYNFALTSVGNMNKILFIAICAALYLIGLLVPDMDSPKSLLGRWIYIPVKHRTWLHAIWIYLIIIGCSYFFKPLFWLGFGCIIHLFWDSLSVGGICWFYPISKYIQYESGAQIKKRHFIKFYRTGHGSECVVTTLLFIVTIAATAYIVYLSVHLRGIDDVKTTIDAMKNL